MKALILNSGIGKRMGKYTEEVPKCMVPIDGDQTILSRQLQLLKECEIKEIVITTGPFEDILKAYVASLNLGLKIQFVHNPLYAETNYIYSIYLAKELLQDDLLLLHGDLIFTQEILQNLLDSKESRMVVSSTLPLPEKDFKAVVRKGKILKVGIEFFENAYAAQPLYKLNKQDWLVWLKQIEIFCEDDTRNCYAENAFNQVSEHCHISMFDIKEELCSEIDNEEDLENMRRRLKEESEA